jgi:hypothetical protein
LHQHTYPGYGLVDDIGSVEMYDYLAGDANAVPQQSLAPPLTVTNQGGPSLPSEVKGFGHGFAVADVNVDTVDDLIVGALNTAVWDTDRDGSPYLHADLGRTYVILGHGDLWGEDDFWDQPYKAWLGIDAPESPDVHDGVAEDWGTRFGAQIVGVDLCGAYGPEVVVGRPDTNRDATPCNPQPPLDPDDCPPQGGSVYVFRGEWLHHQFDGNPYDAAINPSGTYNLVITPPRPDPELVGLPGGLNATSPEYQLLRNPFGDVQPTGSDPRSPQWHDWFGWFVFNAGDTGSPQDDPEFAGDLDGVNDLVVHLEDCDFIGNGSLAVPQVGHVGGLTLYHGRGNQGGPLLVDPRPVLLQRPINVNGGIPSPLSRIGRAFARAEEWFDCLTGQLEPALFIGETDSSWDGKVLAGRVDCIRLPLPPPAHSNDPWWVPLPIVNAWGATALIESPLISEMTEQGPRHEFGSCIVTLDYKGLQSLYPGQQLVISARQASVLFGGSLKVNAGRAYPFLPVYSPCSPP